MMAFWWIVILIAVAIAVRWLSQQKGQLPKEDSALEVLRKRYARGEISKEEFEAKKKDLGLRSANEH